MAGLKQTQLDDMAIAFWTFDSDRTGLNGNMIVDEIGNNNPMIVNGTNYWLEHQSLNVLEPADQYAMSVAMNQKVNGVWENQFFEVVHTTAFDFPDKGEFSVEWLMYKELASLVRQSGEPGAGQHITTPLISKGGVFSASIRDAWQSVDDMTVSILGRSITVNANTYPIFNRVNHCVATYTVEQTDVNEYTSYVKFYLNGRLMGTNTQTHVNTYPNTSTSASWLFCGNGGTNPVSDFATELLTMDQIAVYPYGLTEQQVANHYRKTKQYDQMIRDDQPVHYWRFDEVVNPLDSTIYSSLDSGTLINGTYYGAVNNDQVGPPRIVTGRSAYFQSESSGYFERIGTSGFIPFINPTSDYTLEFWFKSNSGNRGMLFDCTEEAPPRWDGLRVYLNSRNNSHSPGDIQVSESYTGVLNSLVLKPAGDRYLFNDDNWHHLAIRRTGTQLDLFLDGMLHASGAFAGSTVSRSGQIHVMTGRGGDFQLAGNMCELVYYQRALQDQQIYNRFIFSTRYKISGYTLLQGAPVQAIVRFYDSITGKLISEVMSDGVTGEYTFYPLDNRHLDVVSKLPNNNTTRYRVHGPVAPAEYDDSHIQ